MKTFIKSLSLTLLIATPAFAAQQQAEHKQDASQAQLDALQFAKEQESKKIAAAANDAQSEEQDHKINAGLKELLKGATIKGQPFNVDRLDSLPADVQTEIAQTIYSHAISHGYQLLPAIVPDCGVLHWRPSLGNRNPGILRYIKKFRVAGRKEGRDYQTTITWMEVVKKGPDMMGTCLPAETVNVIRPKKSLTPCDISGRIVNDNLYLVKGHSAKKILDNCSPEQLALLRTLWHKDQNTRNPHFAQFTIDENETEIYNSLPELMRNTLETNYKLVTTDDVRRKRCCTRTALAAVVGAAATATGWLMNK